jgi:hypothetical protein
MGAEWGIDIFHSPVLIKFPGFSTFGSWHFVMALPVSQTFFKKVQTA